MEQWKNLSPSGFDGYDISDEGRIRNNRTGRVLAQSVNQNGQYKVGLVRSFGEPATTLAIGVLVATYFLAPDHNERFNTPIHLNGDRSDCSVQNLMWRPRWFAVVYHKQFKRPPIIYDWPIVMLDTDEVFECPRDAAMKYGLLEKDIDMDIQNQKGVWPYGYDFRFFRE